MLQYTHNGRTMTEDEMHARQTPAETYRDCLRRMDNMTSPAERERLHRRWLTLADCDLAMRAAFTAMTDAERADDLAGAEADAEFAAATGTTINEETTMITTQTFQAALSDARGATHELANDRTWLRYEDYRTGLLVTDMRDQRGAQATWLSPHRAAPEHHVYILVRIAGQPYPWFLHREDMPDDCGWSPVADIANYAPARRAQA